MRIDGDNASLTPEERRRMAAIAERLRERHGKPPSPAGYQEAINEAFGTCFTCSLSPFERF